MSSNYKARDSDAAYFITMTVIDWIDLFTRSNHKDTIIESLKHSQKNKGLEIYAYVIMPSHIHMLCRVTEGHKFTDFIRDFKRHTSKQLIENIKGEPESRREWLLNKFKEAGKKAKREQQYKIWRDGYHAIDTWSNKFIYQKLNYIHNNPVEDKIVVRPEDYLYSSARNYADEEGLLDVVVIPPQFRSY